MSLTGPEKLFQQHNIYPSISEMHGYLNEFGNLCQKCETSLEHLFGPLGMR